MRKLIIAGALVLGLAGRAAAVSPTFVNDAQLVIKDTVTIIAVNITTFSSVQVDSPTVSGSHYVVVESTSMWPFCCSFNINLSTVAGAAWPCARSERASTDAWAVWKLTIHRWAQNLKLYCKNLSPNEVTEVRTLQGR